MSEQELERVLDEARRGLSPTEQQEQELMKQATELMKRVEAEAKRLGAEVELGGSLAKGTWLPDDVDIDIFVKFPADLSEDELERRGIELGLKALGETNAKLRYAEHPYVEGVVNGKRINIVPCFSVEPGKWRTIADRSPYHVRWVRERLSERQREEVRLLKAFMKKAKVYGAEIEVEGFSGFVCELLIIHHQNFTNLLKFLASWRPGEPLSPQLAGGDKRESIWLPDPVDPARNLGRAISLRQMARVCLASRAFLSSPSTSYFLYKSPSKISPYYLLNSPLMTQLLLVIFKHKVRSEDILFGQLKKTLKHLVNQLKQAEFSPWHAQAISNKSDESGFIFLLERTHLSRYKLKLGPLTFDREHADDFLRQNAGEALMLWIGEEGRLRAVTKRKFVSAAEVLKALITQGSGVAEGLRDELAKGRIYEGLDIVEALDKHEWLLPQLSEFIRGDVPRLLTAE